MLCLALLFGLDTSVCALDLCDWYPGCSEPEITPFTGICVFRIVAGMKGACCVKARWEKGIGSAHCHSCKKALCWSGLDEEYSETE